MLCKFYLFLLILFFVMARMCYGWGKHLTLPATRQRGKRDCGNKIDTPSETTANFGTKCPQDQLRKTPCLANY